MKRFYKVVSTTVLTASVSAPLSFACDGSPDPVALSPVIELTDGTGATTQLQTCDKGTTSAQWSANGTDTVTLRISTSWASTGSDSVAFNLTSPDNKVSFIADDGTAKSATTKQLSASTPKATVAARAGTTSGTIKLTATFGAKTVDYCVKLQASPPSTIQLAVNIVPRPTDDTALTMQVDATPRAADGTAVSADTKLQWFATNCAFFAASVTAASADAGVVSNILYFPPGRDVTKVTVQYDTSATTSTTACVSPFGVYAVPSSARCTRDDLDFNDASTRSVVYKCDED